MLETLLLAATISMQVKADYYCYMQAPNGQIIDMAYMCPPPPILEKPETEGSAQEATPQLTGAELQEALDLASTLHADAYCEARARGGTNRQADDAATSVLADYLFSSGISADSLTPEFFADSQGRSELLCPELQPTGRYD